MSSTDSADVCLKCMLDDWYAAAVLAKGDRKHLIDDFPAQCKVYPTLKAKAQAKLMSLKGIPDQRCFISKIHRQYLERVLK